jgi:hypothetical protein
MFPGAEAGPGRIVEPGGVRVQGQQRKAGAEGRQGLSEYKSGNGTLEFSHRGGDEQGKGNQEYG